MKSLLKKLSFLALSCAVLTTNSWGSHHGRNSLRDSVDCLRSPDPQRRSLPSVADDEERIVRPPLRLSGGLGETPSPIIERSTSIEGEMNEEDWINPLSERVFQNSWNHRVETHGLERGNNEDLFFEQHRKIRRKLVAEVPKQEKEKKRDYLRLFLTTVPPFVERLLGEEILKNVDPVFINGTSFDKDDDNEEIARKVLRLAFNLKDVHTEKKERQIDGYEEGLARVPSPYKDKKFFKLPLKTQRETIGSLYQKAADYENIESLFFQPEKAPDLFMSGAEIYFWASRYHVENPRARISNLQSTVSLYLQLIPPTYIHKGEAFSALAFYDFSEKEVGDLRLILQKRLSKEGDIRPYEGVKKEKLAKELDTALEALVKAKASQGGLRLTRTENQG